MTAVFTAFQHSSADCTHKKNVLSFYWVYKKKSTHTQSGSIFQQFLKVNIPCISAQKCTQNFAPYYLL